ncbi:MAG: hypothetical protein MJ196_00635 [Treponemataceae bacterium]|nr:hypothetical protein [Treponemataceae bacterium]
MEFDLRQQISFNAAEGKNAVMQRFWQQITGRTCPPKADRILPYFTKPRSLCFLGLFITAQEFFTGFRRG